MLKIKAPDWSRRKFKELGRGGEGAVYKLKDDLVAKIFHDESAPEYKDQPELIKAAKARIKEMQTKLVEFPTDLPSNVAAPTGVLLDRNDKVFGYVMPMVSGISLDKFSRTTSNLTPPLVMKLLMNLHDLVVAIHAKDVVIGDFTENQIIQSNGKTHLIDADSMQFGKYLCKTFTPRFAAPELIALQAKNDKGAANGQESFTMVAQHSKLTDWYSFLVIAMRLLVFTDPYGGLVDKMTLGQRIAKRMTIFNPGVRFPVVAKPLGSLPRPILEIFFRAFYRHERFIPEKEAFRSLLEAKTTPQINRAPTQTTAVNKKVRKKRNGNKQPQPA